MGLIYSNIPELEGSNTEICLANLRELEGDVEMIVEKRLAHLAELANAIMKDGGDTDVINSIILSIKAEGNADSGNIIEENRHEADFIFSKLSTIERLTVIKEIFSNSSLEKRLIYKWLDLDTELKLTEDATDRIAYLQNSYTDTVYMQFSSLLNYSRATYFESITDVCEGVFNDNCEYCILPIETSADGKLLSFYEMILKYDLKINAVYDLYSNDNKNYTRYALLSKKLNIKKFTKSKSKNRYFEFLFSDTENLPLDDLLSVAKLCSFKLHRIDTLKENNEKSGKQSLICPIFRSDSSDLQTFLAFLKIDCPDFIAIGLYNHV